MSEPLRLYVVAAVAALLLAHPTPVYWDSWGYVRQALAGDVGGLGLGRPVFVLVSQGIAHGWLLAGGSVWHVELVLRLFWSATACTAAPLTWQLAIACDLPPRAARLAGLAVACSPAMAHVSGTLLTDGPASALLLCSFVFGVRAVRSGLDVRSAAVAGAALGLAAGVREQAALAAVAFPLLLWVAAPARRLRLGLAMTIAAVVAGLTPIVVVALAEPGYLATIRTWLDGMAQDRARRTVGWRDLAVLGGWLLSLGPVIVISAAGEIARRRSAVWAPRTALCAIVVASFVQLAAVIGLPGMAYSPRFLVSGFAGAVVIPGALLLDRWAGIANGRLAAVLAGLVAPLLIAAPIVHTRAQPVTATLRALPAMLFELPSNAAIVTGYPCPAISSIKEQVAHDRGTAPDWLPVCPGWAWPPDLSAYLDAVATAGRPIAIDLRPTSWVGAEQQAAFREAAAYAERRPAIVWK
jgi:hypothetical protein